MSGDDKILTKEEQAAVLTSIYGEEGDKCGICFQEMPAVTWRFTERSRAMCCGKFFCISCRKDKEKQRVELVKKMKQIDALGGPSIQERASLREEYKRSSDCPICEAPMAALPKSAFQHGLRNAKEGKVWAQFKVAHAYDRGEGVDRNEVEAARWFKIAAENGHPHAMNDYCACLMNGEGVERSVSEAAQWADRATDLGFLPAQTKLGKIYLNEFSGREQEAMDLLRLSAEQGHDEGQFSYGLNLRRKSHQGIPLSMKWIRRSAAQGFDPAIKFVEEIENAHGGECDNCRKPGTLMRCTKCKIFCYCSRECQKHHWKNGHREDCCDQD